MDAEEAIETLRGGLWHTTSERDTRGSCRARASSRSRRSRSTRDGELFDSYHDAFGRLPIGLEARRDRPGTPGLGAKHDSPAGRVRRSSPKTEKFDGAAIGRRAG